MARVPPSASFIARERPMSAAGNASGSRSARIAMYLSRPLTDPWQSAQARDGAIEIVFAFEESRITSSAGCQGH